MRSEYNSILAKKKIAKQLNQIKQHHFELGEKPRRLLARQLKQSQASRAIHKIQTENGEIIDQKRINKCFADFYKEVYTSKGNIDINEINKFLSNIDLPQISEEAVEMLEKEITLNEVNEVVNNLPNNKCAGPDVVQC